MLAANLHAIARQILEECKWKQDKALPMLIQRMETDKAMLSAIIHEAASSVLRETASQQRTKLHRLSSGASAGIDDTRGLAIIAREGYLDTYLLLNDIPMGDAVEKDLNDFISHHASTVRTSTQRIKLARGILGHPKFKKGKRVRDCLSEMDIVALARKFKC